MVRRFPALSETFVLNQITGLIDLGHEVDIYTTVPGSDSGVHPDVRRYGLLDRTRSLQVPRGYLRRFAGGARRFVRGILSRPRMAIRAVSPLHQGRSAVTLRPLYMAGPFFRAGCYDVVHCHYGVLGQTGLMLRELGVPFGPLIVSFHGFDITSTLREKGEHFYDGLFRRADMFLPISRNWRNRLLSLGCPADRTHVHHMAVDCDRFAFRARGVGEGEPVRLVSVARLVEKKGLEYSIRAVAELLEQGLDLRYTVIGDGELGGRLRRLSSKLGVDGRVELVGSKAQDAVLEHLDQSHILLAPSVTAASGDQEGIPVVIMEAMAMGLPVVSTLHSGIPELVDDGATGLLVPERDSRALAAAVRSLAEAPQRWPEMGAAGRRRVEEEFSAEVQVARLERLYRTACRRGPR